MAVAFDASGSMRYPFNRGAKKSKFEITKELIKEFIKKRVNDNLSIVTFGKFAFIVSPLSYDKEAILQMVDNVRLSGVFSDGTALGDGIAQAVRTLKNSEAKNKIIVLITDGKEEGEPVISYQKATMLSKEYHIKIYTIGVGEEGDFDRYALEFIANNTGGKFFVARNKSILKEVFNKIDQLEKSKIKSQDYFNKRYLFVYPLFVAIMGLLFYIYIKYKDGR